MPHFILEHSTNIDDELLALDQLFEKLHNAALATKLYPLAGIRSRAHRCDNFRVANGNPNYAFLHLQVKIGAGRSDEEKQSSAQAFFKVLSEHLAPIQQQQGLGISFELNELPEVLKYNLNNLREHLSLESGQ
ncbi:5-carboxymethyl-2-hydroxymuconate Delta-isomerase [Dasania marina]|uniref:5-carboxymethyl-2-hydroxymuconate Delta-isomerase n=1 Tax=Dasania marina TaxID=471499 RepID=UPI0030DCEB3A|tara:strand:- start:85336 stop:85734 length:399 start_codon:yes stop_codon:yes gene_type:complete